MFADVDLPEPIYEAAPQGLVVLAELFESPLVVLLALSPLIIFSLILMATALESIFSCDTYKMGNRVIWVLVVIFVNTVGPLLYFAYGVKEK